MLYGRSFKKLDWGPDGLEVNAMDIYDIIIDPLVNPIDIETARFIIHQNIFRSLHDILEDERYTTEGRKKLKQYLTSEDAVVQSGQNRIEWEYKTRRLREFDTDEHQFDWFNNIAAGDVIVNLTEHISNVWNAKKKVFEKRVIIYADDAIELMDQPLMKVLGVDFYPYVTWGDDIETNDFWSDGPGDLVRTPNKILNIWYSQMVENRTLSNFQMHWFDATQEGYEPQTYEPGQGRMLPAPGNPKETIMPVGISGLDETMEAINFIIRIVERSTAATAIDKGVSEKKQSTLGEVEILVGKAMERTVAMAKFYRRSWYELSIKWYALMDANQKGARKLYRLSTNGKMWPRTVTRKDWVSEEGFKPTVSSSSEQEEEKTAAINRFMFVRQQFPNNKALDEIAQKRSLEVLELTPAELRAVEAEQEKADKITQEQAVAQQTAPGEQPQQGAGMEQQFQQLGV